MDLPLPILLWNHLHHVNISLSGKILGIKRSRYMTTQHSTGSLKFPEYCVPCIGSSAQSYLISCLLLLSNTKEHRRRQHVLPPHTIRVTPWLIVGSSENPG